MGWEKKHISLLIELYKKEPVLYSTTHKNYRNRYKREAAWNRIIETISKQRPNTGVRDIRDKIENLRTVYALQKRRVENLQSYVPTIWYYPYLNFLNEHLRQRKSSSDSDNDIHQTKHDLEYDSECDVFEKNTSQPGKKGKCSVFNKSLKGTKVKYHRETSNHQETDMTDEFTSFGVYIADRLRSIGGETSRKLEDDILCLILEAEMKKPETAKAI